MFREHAAAAERPLWSRVLPDFLAFGIGLGVAWGLDWRTTDLVWSLWLCSLVLGYLTLLAAVGRLGASVFRATRGAGLSPGQRGAGRFGAIVSAVFLFAFFSLHFCAFHAGHSVFLQQFFPLAGLPRDGFGDAFMNPPLLWLLVFDHLLVPYGPFLIAAIIAERRYLFRHPGPMRGAGSARPDPHAAPVPGRRRGAREAVAGSMGRPYLNVVRMHLLIFFFAFCDYLQLDSFPVFAVVYFVYFFPWNEVPRLVRRATRGAASAEDAVS